MSQTKIFLIRNVPSVSSTLQWTRPLCIGFSALRQITSTSLCPRPRLQFSPSIQQGFLATNDQFFSSDLWGSLPQRVQPLPRAQEPHPCFISVLHGLHSSHSWKGGSSGTSIVGPLRRLHSDSETHFYLFTVKS